jgi:hypothetical protein
MSPADEIGFEAARSIAHIGDADFPARLAENIQSIVSFKSSLFMGCVKSSAPQLIHDGLGEYERASFSGDYLGPRLSEAFLGEMETSQYFPNTGARRA